MVTVLLAAVAVADTVEEPETIEDADEERDPEMLEVADVTKAVELMVEKFPLETTDDDVAEAVIDELPAKDVAEAVSEELPAEDVDATAEVNDVEAEEVTITLLVDDAAGVDSLAEELVEEFPLETTDDDVAEAAIDELPAEDVAAAVREELPAENVDATAEVNDVEAEKVTITLLVDDAAGADSLAEELGEEFPLETTGDDVVEAVIDELPAEDVDATAEASDVEAEEVIITLLVDVNDAAGVDSLAEELFDTLDEGRFVVDVTDPELIDDVTALAMVELIEEVNDALAEEDTATVEVAENVETIDEADDVTAEESRAVAFVVD